MVANNKFLPIAASSGALVLSDDAWAPDSSRSLGFGNGVADPAHFNKAWKQGAHGAAVMGQIIVDHLKVDATDSDDIPTLKSKYRAALAQMMAGVYFGQDTSTTPNVLTVQLDPAPVDLTTFRGVWVKVANANTGPVTLNLAPLGSKTVTRKDGSPLQSKDLRPGQFTHFIYDSALGQYALGGLAGGEAVTLPVADVTIYVSTAGNDTTADGTQAKPFLTPLAAAMFASRRFYFAGYKLIIQLAMPGTYAAPGILPAIGGQLVIQGDPANSNQYVLSGQGPSGGSLGVVTAGAGTTLILSGLTIQNTGTINNTISATQGGTISISNCVITNSVVSTQFSHIQASAGGSIGFGQGITIYGSMFVALNALNGYITLSQGITVTVAGTPTFALAFALANYGGSIVSAGSNSFSGPANGARYIAQFNGTIGSGGAGVNYFPGSTPGSTNNGGQYG